MEDTHTVIPDFNALLDHYSVELTKIPSIPKGEYAYAAIFDGHSGGEASSFCRANLHTFIMKSCFENECPLEAMRKGY